MATFHWIISQNSETILCHSITMIYASHFNKQLERYVSWQHKKTLTLPSHRQKLHPLFPKLQLLAVLLSGKHSEQNNFQMRLKKSIMIHGEPRQKHNMKEFSKNGETIVYNKMKIPILQT